MSAQAVISSEGWGLFPLSLAVGRGQFLVVVGLRPCAPRGCLATWPSLLHSILLFQGQFENLLYASHPSILWSFKKPQSD